jgi:hypothetical protein
VWTYVVCCSNTRLACHPDDCKVKLFTIPYFKIYHVYKISNIIVKGTSVVAQLHSM